MTQLGAVWFRRKVQYLVAGSRYIARGLVIVPGYLHSPNAVAITTLSFRVYLLTHIHLFVGTLGNAGYLDTYLDTGAIARILSTTTLPSSTNHLSFLTPTRNAFPKLVLNHHLLNIGRYLSTYLRTNSSVQIHTLIIPYLHTSLDSTKCSSV